MLEEWLFGSLLKEDANQSKKRVYESFPNSGNKILSTWPDLRDLSNVEDMIELSILSPDLARSMLRPSSESRQSSQMSQVQPGRLPTSKTVQV